ncbi:MAG: hypothetical protein J0G30_09220 [Actinomycetales bacterium]|nr:hypothetical protein [Actinomycetales bacterium]
MDPSLILGIAAIVALPVVAVILSLLLRRLERRRGGPAPLEPGDRRAVAEAERLHAEALASRMAATTSSLRQR